MTYSSLRRVIVVAPLVLGACAHEVDDYPESLGADDASVVGKSGEAAVGGGVSQLPFAGSDSGSGAAVTNASGGSTGGTAASSGHAGKAGAGATGGAGAGGAGGTSGTAGAGGVAGGGTVLPPAQAGAGATGGGGGGAGGASAGSGGTSGNAGAGGGGTTGGGGTAGSGNHAGSGGSGGSGGTGGGSGNSCSGVSKWSAGTYSAGDHVQNGVNLYVCKPYPYSGWCGLEAYAPGSGWAWTDAWTLVGPC